MALGTEGSVPNVKITEKPVSLTLPILCCLSLVAYGFFISVAFTATNSFLLWAPGSPLATSSEVLTHCGSGSRRSISQGMGRAHGDWDAWFALNRYEMYRYGTFSKGHSDIFFGGAFKSSECCVKKKKIERGGNSFSQNVFVARDFSIHLCFISDSLQH